MTKSCFILRIIIFSGSKRDEIDSMMRCHKCWAVGGGRRLGGGSLALQGNCSESRAQPRSDIRIFWPLQNTSDGQATANATLNTKTSRSDNIFFVWEESKCSQSLSVLYPFSTIQVIVESTHNTFMHGRFYEGNFSFLHIENFCWHDIKATGRIKCFFVNIIVIF